MKKTIGAINLLLIIIALSDGTNAIYNGIEPTCGFLKHIWYFTQNNLPVVWEFALIAAITSISMIYFVFSAIIDKDGDKCKTLENNVKELTANLEEAKKKHEQIEKENAEMQTELKELREKTEKTVSASLYEEAKLKISEMEEAAFKAIEEMKSLNEEGTRLNAECKQLKEQASKITAENSSLIEKLADYDELKEKLAAANANLKGGKNAIPPAAYQILYMLQKEGRLIDMLHENISEYDDETLGGAFRKLHEDLSGILKERLIIEPVLNEEEGSTVTLETIDPESVKVSGHVPEKGPYTGELVHRGWRLKECKLPELVDGWKGDVIAPAEIEIEQ